jgi:hypothetical protein
LARQPALAPCVCEDTPDRCNLDGEVALLHHEAGPCGIDNAGLGDILIGVLDERLQHRDRSGTEDARISGSREDASVGIQPERPDFKDPVHPGALLAPRRFSVF